MDDTPRSERFDDVYFSAKDGVEETKHVFFDGNNLPSAWQGRERFTVVETGFGTGLNFLLTWKLFEQASKPHTFLDFVSVEKFPMSAEQIRKALSPWSMRLEPYLTKLLDQYPVLAPVFHRIVFGNRVALTLIFGDANDMLPEVVGQADAWFLDGFTPAKNPDMWTEKVFGEMARLSHNETTFATFTAAGFVKRGLKAAGFHVEKRKGFGWKRDMLAGHFAAGEARPERQRPDSVHIAGAGLAGCAVAYVLKQYGLKPVLYDPNGVASGASGNPVGLINPRFTAFRNDESDFYSAAFSHAARAFPAIKNIEYAKCGSLHLITDADKDKKLSRTLENWGWDTAHMRMVDAGEASSIAGVEVQYPALYLADGARVNPAALCRAYADGVEFKKEQYAPCIGDTVILANGADAGAFIDLPVHTVRGQITCVKANARSKNLKTNLCYGGYISACGDGHAVGSTFQKWLSHSDILSEDDTANLENLEKHVPAIGTLEICGSRAAQRTSSQDRFPIIGKVEGNNEWFVTTAHGSHGIISTLAGAHLIADYLRGGPFSLGQSTMKALSPARFAEREARKKA